MYDQCMTHPTAEQLTAQLTAYLFDERDQYGTRRPSIVRQRVETEIIRIAETLAAEVVAEHPQLREVLRNRTRDVISAALRDDSYLNDVVVRSVSKALGQLVRDAGTDRDDDD